MQKTKRKVYRSANSLLEIRLALLAKAALECKMSEKEKFRQELEILIWSFMLSSASFLLDALAYSLWVFIQWLITNYLVLNLQFSKIDQIVQLLLQALFAISTITPLALRIGKDIRKRYQEYLSS